LTTLKIYNEILESLIVYSVTKVCPRDKKVDILMLRPTFGVMVTQETKLWLQTLNL